MGVQHLVKIGLMGVVGQFDSPGFDVFPRDARVICRTRRGLEVGTVFCLLDDTGDESVAFDGQILRRPGAEDELIIARLERYRDRAFLACEKLIRDRGLPGVLIDVEHLFDGESVFFYFLGDVDDRLEALTQELAATYDRKVQFRRFAEKLASGCGPDCGTGESQCSTGGCGSCAVSRSCGLASK